MGIPHFFDDVTSVYFWYFSTQKSFGKIVGNPHKLYIFGIKSVSKTLHRVKF